jgi:ParB-like chromosome segregation protein Spo0J
LPSRLYHIDLEDIDVGYNAGAERERAVLLMMGSVREFGIINPVTVYRIAAADELQANSKTHRIVAGRIRGEAARRMGLATIACIVVEADELERELIAIDENFIRTSLSPAEEAIALGRRKQIHEALNGRAKSKGAHAANAAMGNSFDVTAKMAPTFTTVAARALDRSERQVQRIVERASLGTDDLARIAGTSLDRGTEIDLLLKLSPEQRAQLIDRAAAGETVSAVSSAEPGTLSKGAAAQLLDRPADNPSTKMGEKVEMALEAINPSLHAPATGVDAQPDLDGAHALMDAWRAASEPERMAFLAWVTASSTAAAT